MTGLDDAAEQYRIMRSDLEQLRHEGRKRWDHDRLLEYVCGRCRAQNLLLEVMPTSLYRVVLVPALTGRGTPPPSPESPTIEDRLARGEWLRANPRRKPGGRMLVPIPDQPDTEDRKMSVRTSCKCLAVRDMRFGDILDDLAGGRRKRVFGAQGSNI